MADLFTKTTISSPDRYEIVKHLFNNEAVVLKLKDNGEIDHESKSEES